MSRGASIALSSVSTAQKGISPKGYAHTIRVHPTTLSGYAGVPACWSNMWTKTPSASPFKGDNIAGGDACVPRANIRPIKSSHPCNEFAPIGAAHPLSNFASSYSGKNFVLFFVHPRTIPPPRSAVLLTPRRCYRAREKHALPCDAPLSLYRCADSRWSGRRVWTWLFATSAAPKDRRRCATFRRVVNYWFLVLCRVRGVDCELMSNIVFDTFMFVICLRCKGTTFYWNMQMNTKCYCNKWNKWNKCYTCQLTCNCQKDYI